MTDQAINGAAVAATNPNTLATERFAKAYLRAKAPGGQLQLGPQQLLQMVMDIELMKLDMAAILDVCKGGGMPEGVFNAAQLAQLTAAAVKWEAASVSLIVPGRG